MIIKGDIKTGDFLFQSGNGYEVLAVLGKLVCIEYPENYNLRPIWLTIDQLNKSNFYTKSGKS